MKQACEQGRQTGYPGPVWRSPCLRARSLALNHPFDAPNSSYERVQAVTPRMGKFGISHAWHRTNARRYTCGGMATCCRWCGDTSSRAARIIFEQQSVCVTQALTSLLGPTSLQILSQYARREGSEAFQLNAQNPALCVFEYLFEYLPNCHVALGSLSLSDPLHSSWKVQSTNQHRSFSSASSSTRAAMILRRPPLSTTALMHDPPPSRVFALASSIYALSYSPARSRLCRCSTG
jgi:hypothetical protein